MGSHHNALPLLFADFILYRINCYFSDFWGFHYQKYFPSDAYFNASQLTRIIGLVHIINKIISCQGLSRCTIYQSWLESFLSSLWGSILPQRKRGRAPAIITSTHISKFLTILLQVFWNLLVPLKSQVLTNAIAIEYGNEDSFPKT